MSEESLHKSPRELAEALNLPFMDDVFLLSRALTHRSYINENKDAIEDNERLEFLGDAVLDFIAAEWLYNQFPDKPEGTLTRLRAALVHTEQLAEFARLVNLGPYMRLGKGELQSGGKQRSALLCDAFEAVIGAIYLKSGLEAVNAFIMPIFEKYIDEIVNLHFLDDTKSLLQEWAQGQKLPSPIYVKISETGPDHAKSFEMEVRINNIPYGRGQGSSKQIAEKDAAKTALIGLNIISGGVNG